MATLTGKKALVLGGSRSIGAAIVERLAAEEAEVTFTYGSSEEAARELAAKTKAKPLQADSADRTAISKLITEQGPLDILVVNAGIGVLGHSLELNPDDVDRMIDINVRGPYHAAVNAAREMPDGGRIVIILDIRDRPATLRRKVVRETALWLPSSTCIF